MEFHIEEKDHCNDFDAEIKSLLLHIKSSLL
jgi:hypothetical protein